MRRASMCQCRVNLSLSSKNQMDRPSMKQLKATMISIKAKMKLMSQGCIGERDFA